MNVAVVGMGIHGCSAAKALAQLGHEVTLYDQFKVGHRLGSSHGESRIIRKAYPDAFFTSLMEEAYPLWKELEIESGTSLLQVVGLAYFGRQDSADLKSMVAGLNTVGVTHQVLASGEARAVLPQLKLSSEEICVFTPEAGWVRADLAIQETLRLAEEHGARLETDHKCTPEFLEDSFDAYAVLPGSWIQEWVPDLDVQISLQSVGYFDLHSAGAVWIEDSSALAYGFPSIPGLGTKVALHRQGPLVTPSLTDRTPNSEDLDEITRRAAERFEVKAPRMSQSYACVYTNTPGRKL